MLLVLLPVPKFIHKNKVICGVLVNQLVHECIDKPLKKAAGIGIMMLDPLSWYQYCFTPLVGAIIDTPEALLYAGIGRKLLPSLWQHTNSLVTLSNTNCKLHPLLLLNLYMLS